MLYTGPCKWSLYFNLDKCHLNVNFNKKMSVLWRQTEWLSEFCTAQCPCMEISRSDANLFSESECRAHDFSIGEPWWVPSMPLPTLCWMLQLLGWGSSVGGVSIALEQWHAVFLRRSVPTARGPAFQLSATLQAAASLLWMAHRLWNAILRIKKRW